MDYILLHDEYWRKMDYILFIDKIQLILMNYVQRSPFCTEIEKKYNKDISNKQLSNKYYLRMKW